MKIINETHYQSADLRAILSRVAGDVLRDEKRKHATITIVYGRKRCSTGCASIGGYRARLRIHKHEPSKSAFACLAAHEFRHLNGWTHAEMNARYSDFDMARYAWAEDMPLRVKEPRRKQRPTADAKLTHAQTMHARAARRLKLARTIERKWQAKVKYYEKKATALLAAGGAK